MKRTQKISISIILMIFLLALLAILSSLPRHLPEKSISPKTVPRTVLVELFVQGDCTTCPTAEFCLEDLAYEYGTSKFILVQEHLWGDGYDTPETNARYDWYVGDSKRGTPDLFIDGLTKRLQGLFCDCVEGNYKCYKEAIDEEKKLLMKKLPGHLFLNCLRLKPLTLTLSLKGRGEKTKNLLKV